MAKPFDFPQKHKRFVADVIANRASGIRFTLNPDAWKQCPVSAKLKWDSLAFTPGNQALVPQTRGIYAFMIEPPIKSFPKHGYLIYIGITGDKSVTRTLQQRYGEYLRKLDAKKRARLTFLLAHWYDHVHFYFATVDRRYNLGQLEINFNDAFRPPGVTGDLSAKVRCQQKALV